MDKKFGQHTIKHKKDAVEVYIDPRMVLRIRKNKKDPNELTIELHNTINGRLSYDLPASLLKSLINEIEG
ncbi:hypothetical protein [Niallia sp. Man26]|uniref:hypothetical protein n=1 Tax=Niallia sp. Man26 TaxID=2912824 RepID=UPI001EDB69AB|nr:hypothetical protein [Niallia sp. Man26]UPO91057.1 hypothetical protein L8T27_026215 [Niallia sp. Man26]